MNDLDARLDDFLRADRPPAGDAAFRLAVLERFEQRRFRFRMTTIAAAGLAATAVVAMIGPNLAPDSQAFIAGGLMPGVGLAIAILATLWAAIQLHRPI